MQEAEGGLPALSLCSVARASQRGHRSLSPSPEGPGREAHPARGRGAGLGTLPAEQLAGADSVQQTSPHTQFRRLPGRKKVRCAPKGGRPGSPLRPSHTALPSGGGAAERRLLPPLRERPGGVGQSAPGLPARNLRVLARCRGNAGALGCRSTVLSHEGQTDPKGSTRGAHVLRDSSGC